MTSKAIKCLKHHFVMLKLGILVKCHDRCTYALPWNADSNMSYELITFTHIVARLKHSNDTPFFSLQITEQSFFLGGSGGSNAARIASSKTFFNPFCVRAEHSTYFTPFSSRTSFSAFSTDMGFCLFFESFSTVPASSLRSTWVPTRRNGVFGQWCVISGTH